MEKKKKIKLQMILVIVIALISFAFLGSALIGTHDGIIHFLRVMGTFETIKNTGNIPIIIEKFCNGWGYAPNLFYNPLSTYVPCIIFLITDSYVIGIKIFIIIMMFLAGIFMYHFAKNITKKDTVGLLAGVLYVTNPYYLCNIFVRGAIGEISALTFLPLLFLGLYDLFERDGKKQYYIVIGTIGIALSHNITLFFAAIFSVIYMLLNINRIKENPKKIIKYCIIDLIFIVTMTAFYTVPLFLNKANAEYAIFDNALMWTNNDFASQNAIELKDLIINNSEEGLIFKIGIPIIVGIILLLFLEKHIDENIKKIVTIFFGFSLLCIFMATKYFPWEYVPETLCILQFPWRMLGYSAFFLSFCSAIGINLALEIKFKDRIDILITCITTICLLILVYLSTASGIKNINKDEEKNIEEYFVEAKELSYMQINIEYLPKNAYLKLDSYLSNREKNSVIVLSGETNIVKSNKEGLRTEIEIENINNNNTILEFPYLYYLGYEAIGTNSRRRKNKYRYF